MLFCIKLLGGGKFIVKEKMLFVMMNLYNDDAEKSLVNLLNDFNYNLYDVNLMLFQKRMFLEEIPKKVTLLDTPNDLKYIYQNPDKNIFKSINNIKVFIYRVIGNKI